MQNRCPETWPLAPKGNIAAVALKEYNGPLRNVRGEVLSGYNAERARQKRDKSRHYLDLLKNVNFDAIANLLCDSKGDLVLKAHEIIMQDTTAKDEARERIYEASLLGIGDNLALMSMLARHQVHISGSEFDMFGYNDAVTQSFPVILFMSQLSGDADSELVSKLMPWSKKDVKRLTPEELMCGLEYDERFFSFSENGAATLKSLEEIQKIIEDDGDKPLANLTVPRKEALVGCPFRSRLYQLYEALQKAMIQNGIAERIYVTNRSVLENSFSIPRGVGCKALEASRLRT